MRGGISFVIDVSVTPRLAEEPDGRRSIGCTRQSTWKGRSRGVGGNRPKQVCVACNTW